MAINMKKLLILLCFISTIAHSQNITGSFGSPKTATEIKGAAVMSGALNIPTNTDFVPTRPGAIRYKSSDSSIQVFTGFNWIGVSGLFTEADPTFNTKFAAKSTSDLTEGTNLYWTNARFDARGDGRYLRLTDFQDSLMNYGWEVEGPIGVVD